MYKYCIGIAVCCGLFIVAGCKQKGTENTAPTDTEQVDASQVKEQTAKAVEATGDFLNQQKDALVDKASQAYSKLETNTQQLMTDLKASGQEAWQQTSSELNSKLQAAQEAFNDLKQASADDLQKARESFYATLNSLQQAYEDAKAKMQETANQ